MCSKRLKQRDDKLIQIADAAFADAARRSGKWLVCRPGCSQCCVGVFAINQPDAARLERGLAELERAEPERAERIRFRAEASIQRLVSNFPGDASTGELDDRVFEAGSENELRFAECGNDEPCPVLDPETGRCELYDYRPMTCRTFGPPVRSDGGLGVCELCFHGASDDEIAACEMVPDPDDLEAKLLTEIAKERGARGSTIVAYCVR